MWLCSGDYISKLHATELNRLIQKLNSSEKTPVEILFIRIHIQILYFPSLFALLLSNKKNVPFAFSSGNFNQLNG